MTKLEEAELFVEQWKNDPRHWTNNKRKLHGYGVLRGKANRKDRFFPPKRKLAELVSAVIEEELPKALDSYFDKLANIRDVPFSKRGILTQIEMK